MRGAAAGAAVVSCPPADPSSSSPEQKGEEQRPSAWREAPFPAGDFIGPGARSDTSLSAVEYLFGLLGRARCFRGAEGRFQKDAREKLLNIAYIFNSCILNTDRVAN